MWRGNINFNIVVEDLVKEYEGKEEKGGLQGRRKGFFVGFCWVFRRREWQWREIDEPIGKRGKSQSGWSKTTGAMDL
ncbi:hypothetical protein BY996DRAFT_6484073 [Phakopsora pachyrhizi]|nr:hypothetical protein BY996DRAFT_6484073 [Phakopsora pachyrhizi]